MYSSKLQAGAIFPSIKVNTVTGQVVDLRQTLSDRHWKLVVVYRGVHCPLCTQYLNQIEHFLPQLTELKVDVIAVSGDSLKQVQTHLEKLDVSYPFGYGLTFEQMKELGLYISEPRSEQESDHRFPEPGLFVINEQGLVQITDISNAPFTRPDLTTLVNGIKFIRDPDNHYPIRGTVSY